MKVGGSAELLGQHVTASVVKSIFVVIILDGAVRHLLRGDRFLGWRWSSQTAPTSTRPSRSADDDIVLSAHDITVAFGDKIVLDKLSLDIRRGEILGFVGASGAGKSVLLRTVLGLNKKQSGTIKLFGVDVDKASDAERLRIDMRLGVLFQHGALFSSLTVLENIQVPMREYLDLPQAADGRAGAAQDRAGRPAARRGAESFRPNCPAA